MLPPPATLGLDRFTDWRPGQVDAVTCATDAATRFVGLVCPTGAGKSVQVVTQALLSGGRTAFLTSTKALADQYTREFAALGLTDIRGANSYPCLAVRAGGELEHLSDGHTITCDVAPCHAGVRCSMRETGCTYYDQLKRAQRAELVVTNYAYWIASHRYGQGLGPFQCLVLDEAHAAPDELGNHLTVSLSHRDIDLCELPSSLPAALRDVVRWAASAARMLGLSIESFGVPRTTKAARYLARLKTIHLTLQTLAAIQAGDTWIRGGTEDTVTFDPLRVAGFAEQYLFLGIPRVVVTSATLTRKTLDLLGVPSTDVTWYEQASSFPVDRRPVTYIPTVRVDSRADDTKMRYWVTRLDQIIGKRLDRKGIVHTVSYARADYVHKHSRYANHLIVPTSRTTAACVETFKGARAPAVLVSPSVTTGYDFPYDECRYQVLGKIPFPDTRIPIIKARIDADPEYRDHLAMQQMVQAAGRGMRAADDACETFVVDDHWGWWYWKHRHLAPGWFQDAVGQADTVPDPPLA